MASDRGTHPSCGQVGCQAWALAEENEQLRKELDDLKEGRTALLPKTRLHAIALKAVADGCLAAFDEPDSNDN